MSANLSTAISESSLLWRSVCCCYKGSSLGGGGGLFELLERTFYTPLLNRVLKALLILESVNNLLLHGRKEN